MNRRNDWLTIPNLLCVVRLFASPLMLPLAWNGQATATLILFLVLTTTDLVDGKLARWLDQRSEIGPRLDSFADAIMYACLTLALVILRGSELWEAVVWIMLALLSYGAATSFAIVKFGRTPSYHTRSAKTAWLLVALAAVTLLLQGPVWPLRVAMLAVLIANLESGLLTYWLDQPTSDLSSVFALRKRRSAAPRDED